jgi:hypothetical protein
MRKYVANAVIAAVVALVVGHVDLGRIIDLLRVSPAHANQSNTWSPTTGTVSGLQLTNNYNSAFSAVNSSNSGSSAPANDVSAAAVRGQWWLNTSGSNPFAAQFYDGTNWRTVFWQDTTNHTVWLGGGPAVAIASLPTCNATNSQMRASVTNGVTSPAFLGTVSTTGAVVAPVFCNGTAWVYG